MKFIGITRKEGGDACGWRERLAWERHTVEGTQTDTQTGRRAAGGNETEMRKGVGEGENDFVRDGMDVWEEGILRRVRRRERKCERRCGGKKRLGK